jgi:hypothetical protein
MDETAPDTILAILQRISSLIQGHQNEMGIRH